MVASGSSLRRRASSACCEASSSADSASSRMTTLRPMDQHAGDGQALALAVGQHLVPARHLLQARGERAEADPLERRLQARIRTRGSAGSG